MRIAVIGSGIAGLGAAWALGRRHEVTLYEKDARAGGHSNTVDVPTPRGVVPVDTGFIVFNEPNYPNLTRFFDALGVETERSNMSFAVSLADGALEWAGDNVLKLFAQKRNLFRPSFHAMWSDILRFNKKARADMSAGALGGLSLGDYLNAHGFSDSFRDNYLLPMGAAIWSTPAPEMLAFPAESFVRFFDNHSLLNGFATPAWRTVTGGSRSYVRKALADMRAEVRLGCAVARVTREADAVRVEDRDGGVARFDQVVLACHSDQALRLLGDPTDAERRLLGAIRYAPNVAILHRDPALMPRRKLVWSSWNYMSRTRPGPTEDAGPVSVTYWMNKLQNIDRRDPLFVSLNPAAPPRADLEIARFDYDHPQFDRAALAAQAQLAEIQGRAGTWFCGAWCGHGFHEDGLTSALEVAERLGAPAPWGRAVNPRIFAGRDALAPLEAAE